jgi:4-hydroxyphenylacetate 3-monooxygenase
MKHIPLKIASLDGTVEERDCKISRIYNLGSATRDPDAAVAHQDEVAKSGIFIAKDVPAPRIYPIGLHAIQTDNQVFVQSDRTSGEVEIVIYVADEVYVGVGSDHTDRALETFSILGSKQACSNHLAPIFWPFKEISDSWDDCILRSWVDGRLYQEVSVSKFLSPPDILSILNNRVSNVPTRDYIVYCGTYVSVDKALGFGNEWRYHLDAPQNNRKIEASYKVVDILQEVKPDYRVPFANPQPA